MGNPNKDSETETEVSGEGVESARKVCQATHDLSREREARDAALAKKVAEAIARKMAKAHYQALFNERHNCNANYP